MALSGGSLQISTTAKVTGRLSGPGNTAGNTIPPTTRTVSGGGTGETSFGTGSGGGDLFAVGEFVVAASTVFTLDLYAGGVTDNDLVDVFGGSAPFRRLMGLVVEITDDGEDTTSGVRIGGASANEWVGYFEAAGDSLDIFPDGPPFAVGAPAGKDVGSSTKNLAIENLSTTASRIVRVTAGGSRHAAGEWVGFWGFLTYP